MCTSILWNTIYTVIVLHGMCSVAALQSFCHRSVYITMIYPLSLTDDNKSAPRSCFYIFLDILSFFFSVSRVAPHWFIVFINYRFLREEGRSGVERWPRQCEKVLACSMSRNISVGCNATLIWSFLIWNQDNAIFTSISNITISKKNRI